MTYYKVQSQIGKFYLLSDIEYLTHLLFKIPNIRDKNIEKKEKLPIFKGATRWLDLYFKGVSPEFKPKYKIEKHKMKNSKIPKNIERCSWCNLNNKNYIEYHDHEWGILNTSDEYLLEMLILESFQAGLSWECVLNKRETFRTCYDGFNIEKICKYSDDKITELLNNKKLIRNKLKIKASINNAKIFKEIIKEYQGFYNYLKTFTKGKIIYEVGKTKSDISDKISIDLSKRGMKFVGSTIIYSYLQAIGIIYSHDKECFMYKTKN